MRELRCSGCNRLLGYTSRTQAVPAQCTDPFCATEPARTMNEERDSFITHLVLVEQQPIAQLSQQFGMTRQGISRIVASR